MRLRWSFSDVKLNFFAQCGSISFTWDRSRIEIPKAQTTRAERAAGLVKEYSRGFRGRVCAFSNFHSAAASSIGRAREKAVRVTHNSLKSQQIECSDLE